VIVIIVHLGFKKWTCDTFSNNFNKYCQY